MKKIMIVICIISLLVITSCVSDSEPSRTDQQSIFPKTSVKTYPSIELPYIIADEDIESLKEDGIDSLEERKDYQVLEKVEVRELTGEENELFLKELPYNTYNNLNDNYRLLEFDFGNVQSIHRSTKSYFGKDYSSFIYDDQIIKQKYKTTITFSEKTYLYKNHNENDGIYGEKLKDFKILILIEKDFLKDGLQFKTKINDEIVYIDIKQ